MSRLTIFVTAVAIAAVPAAFGQAGNSSFAQGVPVRVPAHATLLSDDGTTPSAEPGDDRSATPSATPGADDRGGATAHAEPGDDKGGVATTAKASDDATRHPSSSATRTASASPSDDKGGHSGSGSSGSGRHGGSNDGSGHQ